MKEIPVHITIKSAQKIYEPKNKGLSARAYVGEFASNFDDLDELEDELTFTMNECARDYDDILPFSDDGNGESRIELCTEGVMRMRTSHLEICYNESELTGMDGSTTSLYFSPDKPKLVFMKRRGKVSSQMIFEENTRTKAMYNTGIMPFQICLATKRVDNGVSLENGGSIDIVYRMEINGNLAQANRFSISVKRDDN